MCIATRLRQIGLSLRLNAPVAVAVVVADTVVVAFVVGVDDAVVVDVAVVFLFIFNCFFGVGVVLFDCCSCFNATEVSDLGFA